MQQMKGVSISQGLAVGKIVVLTSAAAPEAQAGTPEEELARFQRAQQQAVRDLGALYEKARAELGEAEAEIFSVHQLMAEDEDFTDLITAAIAGGAEADPNTERLHSGDDAIFLGGVRTGGNTISGLPSGTLCLGTPDGSVYLSVTKTGIDIKGNVTITGDLTTSGGTVNLN